MEVNELMDLVGQRVRVKTVIIGTLVGVSRDFKGDLLQIESVGGADDGTRTLAPIGETRTTLLVLDDETEMALDVPISTLQSLEIV